MKKHGLITGHLLYNFTFYLFISYVKKKQQLIFLNFFFQKKMAGRKFTLPRHSSVSAMYEVKKINQSQSKFDFNFIQKKTKKETKKKKHLCD